jgi:hypothetical protein
MIRGNKFLVWIDSFRALVWSLIMVLAVSGVLDFTSTTAKSSYTHTFTYFLGLISYIQMAIAWLFYWRSLVRRSTLWVHIFFFTKVIHFLLLIISPVIQRSTYCLRVDHYNKANDITTTNSCTLWHAMLPLLVYLIYWPIEFYLVYIIYSF